MSDAFYYANLIPRDWDGFPPEVIFGAIIKMFEVVAPQWEQNGDSAYAREALAVAKHLRHFEQTGQYRTRERPVGNRDMTPAVWRHRRQQCEDHYLNVFGRRPRLPEVRQSLGLAVSTERQYRKEWGQPGHWRGVAALLTPEEIDAAVAAIWNNSQ